MTTQDANWQRTVDAIGRLEAPMGLEENHRRLGQALWDANERIKELEAKVERVEALLVHLHTDLVYAGDVRAALAGP